MTQFIKVWILSLIMVFCSSVQGVRANQLIGYGLVVGLNGTGEKNNAFSEQTFRTMLNNFGIKVSDSIKPKMKDVAPVVVHAELPPFAKPGQTIDVTVSAIGEAKSLRGGSLVQTFLKGADGQPGGFRSWCRGRRRVKNSYKYSYSGPYRQRCHC